MTGPAHLFHIALPAHWAAARASGTYTMSWRHQTLDEVGFVHLSFADQVAGTATRLYADLPEVVLLEVDADRCGAPVVVEAGSGADAGPFPHLYGPLPVDAVVSARAWHRDLDGRYTLG